LNDGSLLSGGGNIFFLIFEYFFLLLALDHIFMHEREISSCTIDFFDEYIKVIDKFKSVDVKMKVLLFFFLILCREKEQFLRLMKEY
jgi:hypothetical protein